MYSTWYLIGWQRSASQSEGILGKSCSLSRNFLAKIIFKAILQHFHPTKRPRMPTVQSRTKLITSKNSMRVQHPVQQQILNFSRKNDNFILRNRLLSLISERHFNYIDKEEARNAKELSQISTNNLVFNLWSLWIIIKASRELTRACDNKHNHTVYEHYGIFRTSAYI